MRGRFTAIIFGIFITLGLSGQEDLHSRNKKAIGWYEQAKELDHAGNWFQSLDLLKQALGRDDSFDEAILLTHQILIKRGEWPRADSLFNKLQHEVDVEFKNRMLLDGAFFNYSEGRYKLASELKSQIEGQVKDIDHRVYELVKNSIDYALEEKARARDITFEELPQPLNDQAQQYFPSITTGEMLVFTVRQKKGRGDEDIFFSQWTENGWSKPISISANINTDRNEGTASISADGRTLVFTGCNKPGGVGSCDLYISEKGENDWTKPQLLSEAVNSLYWESQPSLSQDGRQLYFVSKRPDGMGGQDIWWSQRVGKVWQPARNLGSQVNTSFDDCSPYIHPDGRTLFFASRGRAGFGGYDLYRTQLTELKSWTQPLNLGYPINTHRNQVGYTIGKDGWAYYSDNSADGQTRLYRFLLPEDLLPETPLFSLSGQITDESNGRALSADVIVADIATDSVLLRTSSDFEYGQFRLLIEPNENAYLYIKKKGYLLFQANMSALYKESSDVQIGLTPLVVGNNLILSNILFKFNSADLDEKATKELDLATEFILENPEVTIEIAGHTDSQGDDDYNLELSRSRASAVYQYFLRKGVSKENLVFKGYGESQPIIVDSGTAKDSLNRRIELVIRSIRQ